MTNKQPLELPKTGLLRISQFIKPANSNDVAILPMCKTSFLRGVKEGRYPPGLKLNKRTIVWKAEDIAKLIADLEGAQ